MKKAFSLIELSIVILIIGILVAGVTQGSRLLKQFRLRTAQTLTQSSPVTSIKDLSLWYETSMEASFLAAETEDTLPLSTWYDINPQSSFKNHAVQASASLKPTYRENVFNGGSLPSVRLDGADDLMTFDGTFLVDSNYTIFVVEQRRDNGSDSYFISGTAAVANSNLILGYRDTDTITQAHFANDLDYDLAAYSNPTPRIHTFIFSKTTGKNYWMNGGTSAEATNAAQTTALISNAGASLGRYSTVGWYNGDIGEVIIFTRALKTEERQSVEDYLSKKYAIKLS